jgi:hypothetical protein
MGAKNWLLAYVDADADAAEILRSQPELDRAATQKLVRDLFPDAWDTKTSGSLVFTNPPDEQILGACYGGLSLVATSDAALDYPSRLDGRFVDYAKGRTLYLHAMHSVVDWFAYAIWKDGLLDRALSLSPDSGLLEDLGQRLPCEEPFWEGKNPVGGDYPFPFHPLEMAEEVLCALLGYHLEGRVTDIDPCDHELMLFQRPVAD